MYLSKLCNSFVLTCVRVLKCHQIIHLNRQNFLSIYEADYLCSIYIYRSNTVSVESKKGATSLYFRYLKLLLKLCSSLNYISLPYCLVISRQFHGFFNVSCCIMYHVSCCIMVAPV